NTFQPFRSIAARHGVSASAVVRHRGHIADALARAQELDDVHHGRSLMASIDEATDRGERLYRAAEQILGRALATKDLRTALLAIRTATGLMGEAREYARLRAEATGELGESRRPFVIEQAMIQMPVPADLERRGGPRRLPGPEEESDVRES